MHATGWQAGSGCSGMRKTWDSWLVIRELLYPVDKSTVKTRICGHDISWYIQLIRQPWRPGTYPGFVESHSSYVSIYVFQTNKFLVK